MRIVASVPRERRQGVRETSVAKDCTRSLSRSPTKPRKQPQQAGQAKKNEERPPAESVNYYSTDKCSESRSTRLCGGNHRIGSAAVVLWKMLGKDFPICWVRYGLSNAKNEPHHQ